MYFRSTVADFNRGVQFIRQHTAGDGIIASESIGFLGHYTQRRIVSLDGLLNSVDYYRNVLKAGRRGAPAPACRTSGSSPRGRNGRACCTRWPPCRPIRTACRSTT